MLETMIANTVEDLQPSFVVTPGKEGSVLDVGGE
jgi:hypothetical protein